MTDTEAYAVAESDNLDLVASGNRFITEFENLPDVKRFPSGIYLLHRVYVKLAVNNGIELVSLNAIRRGGGFCSWCLDEIEIIADRTGTRLSLQVLPFDEGPMNADQLEQFYRKHGFVHWVRYGVEGFWMLRLPCRERKS